MKKRFYAAAAMLSLCFASLFAISFFMMRKEIIFYRTKADEKETELVFVYVEEETEPIETELELKWIVKEYKDKIGIFDKEGKLTQIIDTYTKTLPLEDRMLLREGIEINDEKSLYSIIEAYSD